MQIRTESLIGFSGPLFYTRAYPLPFPACSLRSRILRSSIPWTRKPHHFRVTAVTEEAGLLVGTLRASNYLPARSWSPGRYNVRDVVLRTLCASGGLPKLVYVIVFISFLQTLCRQTRKNGVLKVRCCTIFWGLIDLWTSWMDPVSASARDAY